MKVGLSNKEQLVIIFPTLFFKDEYVTILFYRSIVVERDHK